MGEHTREELESTHPNRDVVIAEAAQHELLMLDDRLGVRAHQLHEADETEVFEVLVRVFDEELEVLTAKLDHGRHVLRVGAIGAFGVRQSEGDR